MKLNLFLISLTVILVQFTGHGQAEAVLDANENNKSVGPNKAKDNIRRCPMERYGMCPDIGYDDIAVESQNKLAERKSKCIKMLINVGGMPITNKLIGYLLSTLFKLKAKKGDAGVQQT